MIVQELRTSYRRILLYLVYLGTAVMMSKKEKLQVVFLLTMIGLKINQVRI